MTARRAIAGDDAMAELVAVIGEVAARTLARRFGGTRLFIPPTIGEHHPIRVTVGQAAADQLAGWAGGSAIVVPKGAERRTRALELHRRGGMTIAQIALATDYSERHVFRLLREDADDRQPGLFD